MELESAMTSTPSVRYFQTTPVPDAVLHRALDRARFAPSGGNRQGWHVVVVTKPELRARGAEIYAPLFATYEARARSRASADPARLRSLERSAAFARGLAEVPVHLWVSVDLRSLHIADGGLDRQSIVGGASIYPFVQNLLLALRGEGVGSALTTIAIPAEAELKSVFGIPAQHALAALIAVGWPAQPLDQRLRRKPVQEFATRDRFDGEPFTA
ncbi:MAG TPA: nitroreductase family protein [Candidatus Acidoferrales bacterium]|nr:nitroreductase family protein [Candidatus Acidoferrales bacterium]